jgi:mono/diheme cytochrome c family protein
MVREGRQLFADDGFCYTCHGSEGRGMRGLGSDLADGEWVHTDGSFEGLVSRIRQGVPANSASTGVPMPPRGGSTLSQEQIRAVAAYVWTLSHGGG